jgi:hypothetical protein
MDGGLMEVKTLKEAIQKGIAEYIEDHNNGKNVRLADKIAPHVGMFIMHVAMEEVKSEKVSQNLINTILERVTKE